MEFVQYQELLPGLQEQGIVEAADADGLIRLEMEPGPRLKILHLRDRASRVPPYPDAAVVECSKEHVADLVRQIIDKIHLTEVLVIPVGTWRDLVDCVAYDLAADEDWIEIDAVAALHQNTRNALAITRGETRVLVDMVRALLKSGASPRQDFSITSDASPLLIEVFHDGAASVTCDASIADHFAKAARTAL